MPNDTPYVILVGDDNSLHGSQKIKIIQREKLVNKLWFLVKPYYNGLDMSRCTVVLRYLLPISREFVTETLVLSEEGYEEYLKYVLPINTNLTKEFGDITLNLTFILLDDDGNGNVIQRVRKTTDGIVHIAPIPDYDAVIPDSALASIDQRIIATSAQIKSLENLANTLNINQVDNLVYSESDDTLYLSAKGAVVGEKVSVKDMIDDGIPVVDLNSGSGSDGEQNPDAPDASCVCEDVVEF